jgi:hypothetical protein
MAENEFTLAKKVELIKQKVYDQCPYIKKAQSYVPQEQLAGKKYGNTYTVYIPDAGQSRIAKASDGKDGLKANTKAIKEAEYVIETKAGMNDVELTEWNKLGDIQDFKREILNKRCVNLARTIEKEAIDSTVFEAVQVGYIGELDLDAIGLGSAGLDEASVAGDKVTFINPTVGAKLAKKALGGTFISNDEIAKKLYAQKYLGTYAESAVVTESLMPTIVASTARTASITLTAVTDATGTIGFKPVKALNDGSTAKAGDVFKLDGLKLVDVNGMETDKDFYVVVGQDGKIPEIRITVKGKGYGNANAWVESTMTAGSKSLTSALKNGQKYAVIQTRTKESLGFDAYEFDEIPGTKMTKDSIDAMSIQVYEGGNLGDFSSLVRLVVPFACGIPDPRNAVLSYVEV